LTANKQEEEQFERTSNRNVFTEKREKFAELKAGNFEPAK